jgi:hypothetical protein
LINHQARPVDAWSGVVRAGRNLGEFDITGDITGDVKITKNRLDT